MVMSALVKGVVAPESEKKANESNAHVEVPYVAARPALNVNSATS